MEVLFFILIIVFIVVSDKKNKQKKAQGGKVVPKGQAAAAARAQAMTKMQAAKAQAEAKAQTAVRAQAAKVQASAPRNVAAVKVAGQQSPIFMAAPGTATAKRAVETPKQPSLLDEEGCVGGSMAHTHEEGESREEHRRHVESALRREAEERLAAQAALELSEMNLQRLRQAVVMAEILDRPKALRRRA